MNDSIIRTVLNELFFVTEIDPTFISPDSQLLRDLGLSRTQLQAIVHKAAENLDLAAPSFNDDQLPQTPREIVELLSHSSRGSKAA